MSSISQLFIYPFKSASGLALTESLLNPEGFQYDRQFMAIDPNGKFLTARRYPVLLQISCSLQEEGWILRHPDHSEDCLIPRQLSDTLNVQVWQDQAKAWDTGETVSYWISTILGQTAHIVQWQADSRQSGKYQIPTRFSDAAPLLLVSEASIHDTCHRANLPVDVRRFRPNIVVRDVDAFAEDNWQNIRIGEQVFQVMDTCERCILTTRDPDSGQAHPDKQPMKTLLKYHANAQGKTILGVNIKPVFKSYTESKPRLLRVGDAIEIL